MKNNYGFVLLLVGLILATACSSDDKQKVATEENEVRRPWKLICLGDELTVGVGLSPDDAYPALLETRLNASSGQVKVVNAGMKGETLAGANDRIAWILQQRFDAFLFALGRWEEERGVPMDDQLGHWRKMFTQLRNARPEIPVFALALGWNIPFEEQHEVLLPLLDSFDIQLVDAQLSPPSSSPHLWQTQDKLLSKVGQHHLSDRVFPVLAPLVATYYQQ